MTRWAPAALLLLCACGSDHARPSPVERAEPPRERPRAPQVASPGAEATAPWLRALLAFELRGLATDERTMELGRQLASSVACPQPGTGCYVELPLGGQTTQVHLGEDETIQVWGPVEPLEMAGWVQAVERDLDASGLTAVNPPGTRPDRLFRDHRRLLLLHDHSGRPCGGFCPAMMWIATPGHPAAAAYGFSQD